MFMCGALRRPGRPFSAASASSRVPYSSGFR